MNTAKDLLAQRYLAEQCPRPGVAQHVAVGQVDPGVRCSASCELDTRAETVCVTDGVGLRQTNLARIIVSPYRLNTVGLS